MYRTYGLLLPESPFTLGKIVPQLQASFPGFDVVPEGQGLLVANADWDIRLTLEEGQQVLEESQRIAEHIGGNEDELGIRRCHRRVVVSSDVPDPEMEHFGDYLKVMDVLRTVPGLIAIDPQEPSLL